MKHFLTILSLLFFQLSFAQMRVEDIKNDADVIKFVKANYKFDRHSTRKITFGGTALRYLDSTQKCFFDSLKLSSFFKGDINGDGREDLVFCGYINRAPVAMTFVSEREKSYTSVPISFEFENNFEREYFVKQVRDNVLLLGTISGLPEIITIDTLVYKDFSFKELNSVKEYSVDSLKLTYQTMFSLTPVIIASNGSVNLYEDSRVNSCSQFFYNHYQINIPGDSVNMFFKYIAHLPYYKYSTIYDRSNVADGFTWIITVKFKNGHWYNAMDHMAVGPYGIKYVFKYISALFERSDKIFVNKIDYDDIPVK